MKNKKITAGLLAALVLTAALSCENPSGNDNEPAAAAYNPYTDAALSELTVTAGGESGAEGEVVPLAPAFAADTTEYTATVPYTAAAVTITAAPAAEGATVTGLPAAGEAAALEEGENPYTITVTAPDGVTVREYTLTITRLPLTFTTLAEITTHLNSLLPNTPATPYKVIVSGVTLQDLAVDGDPLGALYAALPANRYVYADLSAVSGTVLGEPPEILHENSGLLVSIDLPDTISVIPPGFFKDNTSIISVALPSELTLIPPELFLGCTALANVDIQGRVTGIEKSAFQDCTALASIDLPLTLQTIEYRAFKGSGLTSITIPPAVMTYTDAAGTTTATNDAFESCESLREVVLQTQTLGNRMFYNCISLETVTLAGTTETIETSAFSGCTALASINIPASLTSIKAYAFQNTGLTSIIIPAGVASIPASTFSGCTALTEVILMRPDSMTELANVNAFTNCEALQSIWVPQDLMDTYQAAANWSTLEEKIKNGAEREPPVDF